MTVLTFTYLLPPRTSIARFMISSALGSVWLACAVLAVAGCAVAVVARSDNIRAATRQDLRKGMPMLMGMKLSISFFRANIQELSEGNYLTCCANKCKKGLGFILRSKISDLKLLRNP